MKILFITDGLAPFVLGGMQRHSTNLLKGLLQQGHEISVCMPCPENEKEESNLFVELGVPSSQRERVSFIVVKWPSLIWFPGHYLISNWIYSRRVSKRIRPGEWDVAFAKGFSGWYLGDREKRDYPLAIKFHGYEMFQDQNTEYDSLKLMLLRWAVKRVHKQAEAVFNYSAQLTEVCENHDLLDDLQVFEIPGGVDKSFIRKERISNQNKVVNYVFVGRFERRKGLKELHEAICQYKGESQFHFIGPIPKKNRLSLNSCVYYGEVKDVNELIILLDNMDVMIVPSHSEGMPNTIMEGMARGLAIIGTKVGAVPLLVNEDNGWLIEPRETLQLLNAIIEADLTVLDPKKSKSLQKIRSFDWEQISEKYSRSFEKMTKDFSVRSNVI